MAGASLRLIRATHENGLFSELQDDWERQLLGSEDALQEWLKAVMEYPASIARERPQDTRYGVFVLVEEQEDGLRKFEGWVHINHAWPGTKSATLRLVWSAIAPRYDLMDEVPAEQLARIKTAFVTEAMSLCRNGMQSHELKVYLGNAIDRAFASAAVSFMEDKYPDAKVSVRGGWLHVVMSGPKEGL